MSELTWAAPPPRAELLREVRLRLGELLPGVRVVAEGLLGAEAPIDLLAVEADGRALLVFLGSAGEDLELVGRALAQRAWVAARLSDWLKLAPQLPLRPERGVRALLVCPDYRRQTLDAARALGPEALWLAGYRCVRNGTGVAALFEAVLGPGVPVPGRAPAPDPGAPEPPCFRTGLSDADLGLTDGESAEFD